MLALFLFLIACTCPAIPSGDDTDFASADTSMTVEREQIACLHGGRWYGTVETEDIVNGWFVTIELTDDGTDWYPMDPSTIIYEDGPTQGVSTWISSDVGGLGCYAWLNPPEWM